MIKYIEEIIIRDLDILKKEANLFKSEGDLWKTAGEISNPAGVLSQHLCGNLKHFIGATLGKTGYQRNRELEFSQTGILREELIRNVEETIDVVKKSFEKLNDEDLKSIYPTPFLGKTLTTGELLLIITSHLSYHLGQVNYLRRCLA